MKKFLSYMDYKNIHKYYTFIMVFYLIIQLSAVIVFATSTETVTVSLWDAAKTLIVDVYNGIAGISTVLAGCMSAVAVIGVKMSNNQQKVDQAWDWLKRVWVAWAIINGIGAFIAYIVPLFNGYNTLTP